MLIFSKISRNIAYCMFFMQVSKWICIVIILKPSLICYSCLRESRHIACSVWDMNSPPMGCDLQLTVTANGLPINGCHPRNPCNYVDYYSFTNPEGMEGWVGLVGWFIVDTLPTKWSRVNHRSGVDQGKSASQRPTSSPLSHALGRFHKWLSGQIYLLATLFMYPAIDCH